MPATSNETVAEVVPEAVPESVPEPVVEGKEAAPEAPKPETPEEANEKIQKRFGDMTAKLHAQERMIADLSKKVVEAASASPQSVAPKYTEEEIKSLLTRTDLNEGQKEWLRDQLVEAKLEKRLAPLKEREQLSAAVDQAYQVAKQEFPELADPNSELSKLSVEIFKRDGLERVQNGVSLAARAAWAELNRKTVDDAKLSQKRADKVTAQTTLAGASPKVGENKSATREKLFKEAQEAGMTGPAMMRWLKWSAQNPS